MSYRCQLLTSALCLLLLAGCSSSYRGEINELVADENWSAAAARLETVVATQSGDAWAWRELGRTRVKLDRPYAAISALERSNSLVPGHGGTQLYFAMAHEQAGQLREALGYYTRCSSSPDLSFAIQDQVKSRIFHLNRQIYRTRARELMEQPGTPQENVVAVYNFTATDTTTRYQALRKGLAVLLITDLAQVNRLTLVERLQLDVLLEEIALNSNLEVIDKSTRAEAGRLVGAGSSVSGNVLKFEGDELQIPYYVVYNRTGNLVAEKNVQGHLEDFIALEKQIAYGIIDAMGIGLTAEEERRIGQVPTTSFPAILAFCEGIHLEDEGRYREAMAKYQAAVQIDPGFTQAGLRASNLETATSGGAASTDNLQAFSTSIDSELGEMQEPVTAESPVNQRMAATSKTAGIGMAMQGVGTEEDPEEMLGTEGPATNTIPPVETGDYTIRVRVPVR